MTAAPTMGTTPNPCRTLRRAPRGTASHRTRRRGRSAASGNASRVDALDQVARAHKVGLAVPGADPRTSHPSHGTSHRQHRCAACECSVVLSVSYKYSWSSVMQGKVEPPLDKRSCALNLSLRA